MKRLALIACLAVVAIAAPGYAHSTRRVTAKEAWLVLKPAVKDEADGTGAPVHVDSCVRQARGYRVRCRVTYGFGYADDGRRVCEGTRYVTQDRRTYHVSPRDYECTSRPDGREQCATDSCPLPPGHLGYYGGFSLTTYGPMSAWLGGRRVDDPEGWPLAVADEEGVTDSGIRVEVPFIDLGPRDGRPQIAYSQCVVEGGDCNLWRYDPSVRTEFRLSAPNPSCREVTPALWEDTVVFYREPIPTRGAPRCRAGIYQQTGDGPPQLLRPIDPDRRRGMNRTGVKDIDVQGETVVFLLYRDDQSEHEIWLRRDAGEEFERVAAQAVYRPRRQPIHETDIAGPHVYWTTGSEADGGEDRLSRMFRKPLVGGPSEVLAEPFTFYTAAFSGDHMLFTAPKGTYRREIPADWEPAG